MPVENEQLRLDPKFEADPKAVPFFYQTFVNTQIVCMLAPCVACSY